MAAVDFWFEMASPYSYLSAMRVDREAAERGVAVRWRPFLLGPIFRAQGWETSPFVIYPAKGRYMWRDIERRCALRGVAYAPPPPAMLADFPRHTVLAARLALVGLEQDWGKAFVRGTYRAEFAHHLDIADAAVLDDVLEAVGATEGALGEAVSPATKERLRENTDEAAALRIFGAPSFTVAGEVFWGDDRLEDALDWAARAGG